MKNPILVLATIAASIPAYAQYVGPSIPPTTVGALLSSGKDDQSVLLQGRLIRHLGGEHYRFSDGTGEISVELEQELWPNGVKIDDQTVVKLYGEYDKDMIGDPEIEVDRIEVQQ